jgi:hypothetical protein
MFSSRESRVVKEDEVIYGDYGELVDKRYHPDIRNQTMIA